MIDMILFYSDPTKSVSVKILFQENRISTPSET